MASFETDINFYKINNQEFIFSVRVVKDGPIRYYRLLFSEDGATIYRIKNTISFLESKDTTKVVEFTPDYFKIVTSLIEACDVDLESMENQYIETSRKPKKAIDYRRFKGHIEHSDEKISDRSREVNPTSATLIVESRPSQLKILETEQDQYYELDDADKRFIAVGVANNSVVKSFIFLFFQYSLILRLLEAQFFSFVYLNYQVFFLELHLQFHSSFYY